jgi:hypothetical protein
MGYICTRCRDEDTTMTTNEHARPDEAADEPIDEAVADVGTLASELAIQAERLVRAISNAGRELTDAQLSALQLARDNARATVLSLERAWKS